MINQHSCSSFQKVLRDRLDSVSVEHTGVMS